MKTSSVLILILLTLAVGCRAQDAQPRANSLEIRLQRTACYGTCPVYSLTVDSKGNVEFVGKQYVETVGSAKSTIPVEKMRLLAAEIERADFFSLKDAYTGRSGNCPISATDMPSVTLRVKLNEKEKNIEHYLGCFETSGAGGELPIFPRKLALLEDKIDEIIGTEQWIKKKDR
jgi:Domain of unknown function (DUF6438)